MTDLIEHMKREESNLIAYRYFREGSNHEVTYHFLVEKVEKIASWMNQNWGERNVIAIFGETTYEWMATYLGIMTSNNIAVILDNKLIQEQKERILNELEVDYVFHDSLDIGQKYSIRLHCSKVKDIFHIIDFVEEDREDFEKIQIKVNEDDVAQYIFTSGSTGKSKVAAFSYKNVASIVQIRQASFVEEHDVVLSALPIHHCFELGTQLSELYYGATICINQSRDKVIEDLKYYEPMLMNLVPLQIDEILRSFRLWCKEQEINPEDQKMNEKQKERFHEKFGRRLCRIHSGGAPLNGKLVLEMSYYGIQIINGYGMTEMCGHICNNIHTLEKPSAVGIPFRNDVVIKIAPDQEILIKGPNLMLGYRNMDRSEAFTEDGFLKTGDLGCIDEDGDLHIIGRKKNIILLSNGENVYPEELEALLKGIEGVLQVSVFEWENQITALIYPDSTLNHEKIKEGVTGLNKKLAAYKRITKVYFREKPFPKTGSSKIDKNQLIEEFKKANLTKYVPLNSEEEKLIAKTISQVLVCDELIGALDNFFALGGNSLTALAVAAKLEINPQMLYEHPNVRDLAKAVEQKKSDILQDESYVNDLITHTKYSVNEKEIKNILLTGATGYLGAHILQELVRKDNVRVYCLVRSKSKIEKVYQYYFGEVLPNRVVLVTGDIGKERMGITSELYDNMVNKIDTVIHAAANVHHVGDSEAFMNTNYYGTKRIIEFCKQADAVLHFASSYVSSGFAVVPIHSDVSVFTEQMLYIGQDYKQNIYAHTKYLSEVEILKEREKGLKANIYRMGCLTSRRKDGVFQINREENGLLKRLRGALKLRVFQENMKWTPVDFTAVDECADAFVRLIFSGKVNHIYHMFNPNTVTMKEIGELYGVNIQSVSEKEFHEKVRKQLDDEEIATLSFYTEMIACSKPLRIDNKETVEELKKLGFEWGISTKEYIQGFIG